MEMVWDGFPLDKTLIGWKLTVQCGFSSFLAMLTVCIHHSVGYPTSTFWRISISSIFSSCFCRSTFQWCGTGFGESATYDIATSYSLEVFRKLVVMFVMVDVEN